MGIPPFRAQGIRKNRSRKSRERKGEVSTAICFFRKRAFPSAFGSLLPASSFHLNFKVLNAISARKIVMIQKRTITFGSAHPSSSK